MTTSQSEPREMTVSELLKHLKVYNKAARAEANLRNPNHAVVGKLLGEAAYDAIENLQATLEAKQAELDACSQRVEELKLSVREAVTNKSIYLEHKLGEVEQENKMLKARVVELTKALRASASHWFDRNDPNDPYYNCACMGCTMGDSSGQTDERGHDIDCPVGIAGRILSQRDGE